jgi:SAM-dependent methyltransferase
MGGAARAALVAAILVSHERGVVRTMKRLVSAWRDRFPPRRIRLPADRVRAIVEAHGAQSWFTYAFEQRHTRWDIWESCRWVARNLPRTARVLATGCGCGLNLIWLGQQRFVDLNGFDIDPRAIAAGEDLCREANVAAKLWCDDALAPVQLGTDRFDLITALNWTMYPESFDLDAFVGCYRSHLGPGGVLLFDTIDRSYDEVPNNQYLTSDWCKPEAERKPSEYKRRFSETDVRGALERAGLNLIHRITRPDTVPRVVYVAR